MEAFIKTINIKKSKFANYIDYGGSNLSALLKGRRKINVDLAIKFGEIFQTDPSIWLHIQSKNELMEIRSHQKEKYSKYNLEDLLK